MSIEYTIFKDDDPTKEVIFTTSLSNTSHADWQEFVGLSMQRRNAETGEVADYTVETTIWDSERICFDGMEWLDEYFEKLGAAEPHSELLVKLYDELTASDSQFIYV